MSLTAIAIYAPGDIITSAWANILRTNFGVLDARTGGDPGASGKLSRSNGAASSAWTPANALTDDIATSGALSAGTTGQFGGTVSMYGQLLVVGPATFGSAINPAQYLGGSTAAGVPSVLGLLVGAQGVNILGPGGVTVAGGGGFASSGPVSGTTGQFSGDLGTGGNLGVAGVGTFSQPVAAARFIANVADALTAPLTAHPNQAGIECPNLRAASASVAISANTANLAANANQLGGVSASVAAGPSRIPIADATGKIAAGYLPAVSGGSDVISGLICLWGATTAPTGWVLLSSVLPNIVGRFVAGAGSGWTPGTVGGSNTHRHQMDHGHGGTVNQTASSGNQANIVTPNPTSAAQSHQHDFTINATSLQSGQPLGTQDLPPWLALTYIQKS